MLMLLDYYMWPIVTIILLFALIVLVCLVLFRKKAMRNDQREYTDQDEMKKSKIKYDEENYGNYTQMNRLRHKLSSLSKNDRIKVRDEILYSNEYYAIRRLLSQHKPLKDSDENWIAIRDLVCKESPNLVSNFELAGGNTDSTAFKIVVLVKAGFSQANVARLLCLSRSGVSYHVNTLMSQFLGPELAGKVDKIAFIQNL